MATLEVHDAGSRVRRIRITRDNPVMFGSDPMCDVVLDGPGVQPFHGRIRWKSRRFKADASPDVPWIEVNGLQVKSKSLYQGDEIRIGRCRIFLLSVEDGPDHGEKTTIFKTPSSEAPALANPGTPAGVEFHRMEMAPPSVESDFAPSSLDLPPPRPLPRGRHRPPAGGDPARSASRSGHLAELMRSSGNQSADLPTPAQAGDKAPRAGRWRPTLAKFDRAPGDDRVMTSPMVLGLAVTLVVLVLFSVLLWGMIARAMTAKQYNVAVGDLEAGNFVDAIREFDRFLAASPEDDRVGKARVLRALARVRQHTGAVGSSWGTALAEARAMLDEVGGLEEYRDRSLDLAEDIRKAAEGLADRARDLADPAILAEAESAVGLHARVAGRAADDLIGRSRIPEKVEKARAAVVKARDRSAALAAMDAAIKANRPGDAYSARDALARSYHDLAADKEVVVRLIRANDLIRQAVAFDPSGRPGESDRRAGPLGPPTALVLRLDPGRKPADDAGPVAYALADGFAFGLDAATGAPRWQVAVGVASPFPPVGLAGDPPSALVVDARSDELARLDGRTGALIWRQGMGGPVSDPPLVLGNQVFQPTPDGRLLQLDLATGTLRGTLKLGRKLARTPIADDSARHLYLLGDEDCLFILALDPLSCAAVEYLGHEPGSVPCPPARVGRFFVLPENHELDQGRWRVFVIDEAGTALKGVQEFAVGGWSRATPSSSGPVIWSASDRGELVAYSIGLPESKAPFTAIARVAPGAGPGGPAFGRARTERDFSVASSRSARYELDLERGKLTTAWTLGEAGPALAPPQAFDRVVVLTHQQAGGPGTALWGVDPASGQVRWRTVLGAPWPVGLSASTSGDALTTLAADGGTLTLTRDALRAGGFVEQPMARAGVFRIPASATQRLEVDGSTVVVPGPGAARVLVRSGTGEFRPVDLPAPLGTSAVVLGKALLIPGADGRVYLVDPRTGASAADPYVPTFDRSRPIRWRAPAVVEGEAVVLADSEATLRRLSVVRSPRPRLVSTAEAKLDRPMAADPASTGASVLVATADGLIRSLAARDLGPQESWPLEAPRLLGPVVVADHAFVADNAGGIVAFAPDGRRLWSARIRDTLPAGPPAIRDGSAWFLGRDGSAHRLSMADGSEESTIPLDLLPAGGPIAVGPDLVVPAGLGSLQVLEDRTVAPPAGRPRP